MKLSTLNLVALSLLAMLIGIAKYGVHDGIKINAIAAICALENRYFSNAYPQDIPVYELVVDKKAWASLIGDLPSSGNKKCKATLIAEEKEYPVKMKLRGNLKLHWGGPKKSIRVYLEEDTPFGTIRVMNFVNPKTYQLNSNHIANLIGKRMGVHTIENDLVFLRLNGQNYGLMEMIEQPGEDYEINRGLCNHPVPVFKGDYLDDEQGNPRRVLLWEDINHWEYLSGEDTVGAREKLNALIKIVNADSLSMESKWSSITKYADVDAFVRFYACLKILNTGHIDQTHNHILVLGSKSGKLYPVLWDPTYMWMKGENHFYNFYDPLSFCILQNPAWREQRDLIISEYLSNEYHSGAFVAEHNQKREKMRPAARLDYNKCNPVGNDMNMVYRFPDFLFENSNDKILAFCNDYFEELSTSLRDVNLEVTLQDTSISLDYLCCAPLLAEITLNTPVSEADIRFNGIDGQIINADTNILSLKLYGEIQHEDGVEGDVYKTFGSCKAVSVSGEITIPQHICGIRITNSMTGQEVYSSY